MRIMRRAWGFTAVAAAALMLTSGSLFAGDAPVVHVKAVVKDGAVNLEAQANGPFEYTTYRPSESLYVLGSAGDPVGTGEELPADDVLGGPEARGAPGNPAAPRRRAALAAQRQE